jgi:hypothetical protein
VADSCEHYNEPSDSITIYGFLKYGVSSGLLRRVAWQKFTDVSEVLAASIIRAMTVSTSETSENFYHTTRRNFPEDNRLHIRRRENLKSHKAFNYMERRRRGIGRPRKTEAGTRRFSMLRSEGDDDGEQT